MDINDYKQKFIQDYLFGIVELSQDEVEKIPRDNKKVEYEYLHSKGYFFKEGKYYKRIPIDISNEDILLFSHMKMFELLNVYQNSLTDVRIQSRKIEMKLGRISILLLILIIVEMFFN